MQNTYPKYVANEEVNSGYYNNDNHIDNDHDQGDQDKLWCGLCFNVLAMLLLLFWSVVLVSVLVL